MTSPSFSGAVLLGFLDRCDRILASTRTPAIGITIAKSLPDVPVSTVYHTIRVLVSAGKLVRWPDGTYQSAAAVRDKEGYPKRCTHEGCRLVVYSFEMDQNHAARHGFKDAGSKFGRSPKSAAQLRRRAEMDGRRGVSLEDLARLKRVAVARGATR